MNENLVNALTVVLQEQLVTPITLRFKKTNECIGGLERKLEVLEKKNKTLIIWMSIFFLLLLLNVGITLFFIIKNS